MSINYEGFAIKSRGASHIEKEMPCQDAVQYHQDLQIVTACIADGHGGMQYFRSDRGSDFAANVACRKTELFLHYSDLLSEDETQHEKKIMELIRSIITEWQIGVQNDILHSPFSEDEMLSVPDQDVSVYSLFSESKISEYSDYQRKEMLSADNQDIDISHIYKAYGSTLICLGLSENFAVGLHIGDGKCVAIYEDGSTDEPIPWDEKCHLNLCTSICDIHAETEFRFYIWKDRLPIAVFCASDGIDDTFADRLHSFYMNVAMDLAKPDFRKQVENLAQQLPAISERGSKDDVSIAGIISVEKVRQAEQLILKRMQLEQNAVTIAAEQQKLAELQFKYERTQRILKACTEEAQEKIKRNQEKLEQLSQEIQTVQKHIAELEDESSATESAETVTDEVVSERDDQT